MKNSSLSNKKSRHFSTQTDRNEIWQYNRTQILAPKNEGIIMIYSMTAFASLEIKKDPSGIMTKIREKR